MSHVDEGTLHALLDGALSAAAPAEAERVELHLAACADCRARLDEATRLRDEAGALLGSAQPREFVLPSFDAIRARASLAGPMLTTRPRSFLRSPFNDFAWAAMVLLALGLGWMLNDTIDGDEGSIALTRPEQAPGADAEAADFEVFEIPNLTIDTMAAAQTRAAADDGAAPVAANPSPPVPAAEPQRTDAPLLAESEVGQLAAAEYDVAEEEEAAPPSTTADADARRGAGAERMQRAEMPAAAAAPPPPAAPQMADAVAGAAVGGDQEGWRAITLTEAQRLAGGRVVRLAGARIVSSATRGEGADLEIRTMQLTDRGESIRVVQRRIAAALDARRREDLALQAEAAAPAVVTAGLTVRVEDWTVTISGAVPPERLRELAAGLS